MSVLLGIELQGSTVRLQAVDRKGVILASLEESVSVPFSRWWGVHPDERVRSVRALLQHSLQTGQIRPASIAAVGISCEPSLVLVDAELDPIPPKALGWTEKEEEHLQPDTLLRETLQKYPKLKQGIHCVLDLQDWLRYRWTGALATTSTFAWHSGLSSEHTPGQRWDPAQLQEAGLETGQVPPLFPGPHRVGTLQEDLVRDTGLPRGTWISAGTSPRAARLWLAAEPREGQRIVLLEEQGASMWRVGAAPQQKTEIDQALPSPLGDHWYHREAEEGADPRRGGVPVADVVYDADRVDWKELEQIDAESMQVSADFGCTSRAPALLAGVGLGWFKDIRPIWRKRCKTRSLRRCLDQLQPDDDHQDAETREQT